jgi:hypothetical protein
VHRDDALLSIQEGGKQQKKKKNSEDITSFGFQGLAVSTQFI